jgi:hypothetical protein
VLSESKLALNIQLLFFQFVRREHLVSRSQSAASHSAKESDVQPWFGVRTCQSMLETMLSLEDIDIDLLVLLRDEVQ